MSIITNKPDNNYHSIANVSFASFVGEELAPPFPGQYDDILKISGATDIKVQDCVINLQGGNREDGIDINRFCKNIDIYDCHVAAGRRYSVTIKGGCSGVHIRNLVIHGPRGKEGVDIDLGNYSDSTMKKTGWVILDNVSRKDGNPVTIRVGNASKPYIINCPNARILFWQSLGLKAYVWGKYLLVKLGLLGWEDGR